MAYLDSYTPTPPVANNRKQLEKPSVVFGTSTLPWQLDIRRQGLVFAWNFSTLVPKPKPAATEMRTPVLRQTPTTAALLWMLYVGLLVVLSIRIVPLSVSFFVTTLPLSSSSAAPRGVYYGYHQEQVAQLRFT